ncbi:MAG: alpha/beta fold hydrolase [Bdellovibrionales bacterium]|jgi:predicted alpha/beta-fold hydrolase|nr:alpha/beta fold hydrolase [Bdellovibrionales bacterium]
MMQEPVGTNLGLEKKLRNKIAGSPAFHALLERRASSNFVFGIGHTQTLLGHFLPAPSHRHVSSPKHTSSLAKITTSDGDTLVGLHFKHAPTNKTVARGVLHVFHGLSGSTDSGYMPRVAMAALGAGFDTILWNHRGCGPGRKQALAPYHSGRSDDLLRAVQWGRAFYEQTEAAKHADFRHGVLGYSLSGNATCLMAARIVPAFDSMPLSQKFIQREIQGAMPDFAIAVNPPFDLGRASKRLTHQNARIYGQAFMKDLLISLQDRAHWTPENEQRRHLKELAAKAHRKLSRFDSVETFDALYTGPAGGFKDHSDYYSRASSGQYLKDVCIPLVILSADDDPITHGFSDLPSFENEFVILDRQKHGGHMGFIDQETLMSSLLRKAEYRWLERRIQMYLKEC